jgi:hypothetical protein
MADISKAAATFRSGLWMGDKRRLVSDVMANQLGNHLPETRDRTQTKGLKPTLERLNTIFFRFGPFAWWIWALCSHENQKPI